MESIFVSDIFEVFSEKPASELNFNGKIVIINFKYLQEKNWGTSDFLALCEQSPIILLDNLQEIDLSDKNLARRFILFIGKWDF
jgi:predicted ATPase